MSSVLTRLRATCLALPVVGADQCFDVPVEWCEVAALVGDANLMVAPKRLAATLPGTHAGTES